MNFTQDNKAGKNLTGITIVILLHIVVGYAIVSGLGKRMMAKVKEEVETKIIEEVKPPPPKEVPPPPPPPEMKAPPPPFIPPVEVNVQQPPPPATIASVSTVKPLSNELIKTPPAQTAAPVAKYAGPAHVAPVFDFSNCAKPEWPKSSLRNEETGTVTMQFTIGVDGHVIDSKVVKSSGFRDLDKAAAVGISKCRFKPGLTEGKPEQSTTMVQYVWTLE